LGCSISYWSTGRDVDYFGHVYSWKLSDLIFRTGVNYDLSRVRGSRLSAVVWGLAFLFVEYAGQPDFADNSDTKFGLYIDGGLEHELMRGGQGSPASVRFAEPTQTDLV